MIFVLSPYQRMWVCSGACSCMFVRVREFFVFMFTLMHFRVRDHLRVCGSVRFRVRRQRVHVRMHVRVGIWYMQSGVYRVG